MAKISNQKKHEVLPFQITVKLPQIILTLQTNHHL